MIQPDSHHQCWCLLLTQPANNQGRRFASFCACCRYGHSAFASLFYSIGMDAPIVATIYGPKGRIHINHRAHNPESITLVLNGDLLDAHGLTLS